MKVSIVKRKYLTAECWIVLTTGVLWLVSSFEIVIFRIPRSKASVGANIWFGKAPAPRDLNACRRQDKREEEFEKIIGMH